jgi:hypothetical protein
MAPKLTMNMVNEKIKNSPTSPILMPRLMPTLDVITDMYSSNKAKAQASKEMLDELKAVVKEKKEAYENAKTGGKTGKDLDSLRLEWEYVSSLHAYSLNLSNSFSSMQAHWHKSIENTDMFYDSRIKAGGVADNLMKFLPVLTLGAGLAVAWMTKGWTDTVKIVQDVVAETYKGIVEFGMNVVGAVSLVLLGTYLKQQNAKWKNKMRLQKSNEVEKTFGEEGKVRIAIGEAIKQYALGLCAEFGYLQELQRSGAKKLIKYSINGNTELIWDLVQKRIENIKRDIPVHMRKFFGTSLNLPEYIDNGKAAHSKSVGEAVSDIADDIGNAVKQKA